MRSLNLTDLILNLAGVLLWVNWRSVRLDPLVKTTPATLAGTLRRAEPHRFKRWHFLLVLAGLLFLRAVLYWQIGAAVDWTPSLHLGGIDNAVPFRSDRFGLMVLFSLLSFAGSLGVFYLWLLLPSLVNGHGADEDPVQRLVRFYLGRIDRWPWLVKALLPFLVTGIAWFLLDLLLVRLGLIRAAVSPAARIEQAVAVGLGSYLLWKYLIGVLLGLYLLSSYVYFGNQPFWSFVGLTGRNLLAPLRPVPLRLGRADFAPLVGAALVFFVAYWAQRGLTVVYRHPPM